MNNHGAHCRRSQQSKGRSHRGVSPSEPDCIQKALVQILRQSPRAILLACLESLAYNSGELYEAAVATLRAFLEDRAQRRNGELPCSEGEGCELKRAMGRHAKLSEWLVAETSSRRGASLLP